MDLNHLADFGTRDDAIRKRIVKFSQRLNGSLLPSETITFVSEAKTIYVVVMVYLLIAEITGPYLWHYWWEPSWPYYWPVAHSMAALSTVATGLLIYVLLVREGFYVTTTLRVIRYSSSWRLKVVADYPLDDDSHLVISRSGANELDLHRYTVRLGDGTSITVGRYMHRVYPDVEQTLC